MLTGDVGPHASRVLARLIIIIFTLLEPTEPPSHPSLTHCGLLLKLWRLSRTCRRDFINNSMNDVTSGHMGRPRACPYLAVVVLPELLLQGLGQLAQQEAVV